MERERERERESIEQKKLENKLACDKIFLHVQIGINNLTKKKSDRMLPAQIKACINEGEKF